MAARAGIARGAFPPPSPALPGTKYAMGLLQANLQEKETKLSEMARMQTAFTAGLGHFNAPPQFSEQMSELASGVASLKAEIAMREAEARGPQPPAPPPSESWSTWSTWIFWVFVLMFAGVTWTLALEHIYQHHKTRIPGVKAKVFSKTKEILHEGGSKVQEGVQWCKEKVVPKLEDNIQLALAKARRLGESVPTWSPPDPMRETSKKLQVKLSEARMELATPQLRT
ncbi:hypothetical protein CYMTET_54015 [Cymbomonas tetramitiformis]|uniref:Uncharacterized protein n=1 Tax=Cymbomonas tetramitiformis TaxID=36881 RepID=A0AAE0BH11_9CHLO|nr:hypothetical protein CYMTET_54015 [Cymbomonas tetramitiformis]